MALTLFDTLKDLPPNHSYWHNEFMFTKAVFNNESKQGIDKKLFNGWVSRIEDRKLRFYVLHAAEEIENCK